MPPESKWRIGDEFIIYGDLDELCRYGLSGQSNLKGIIVANRRDAYDRHTADLGPGWSCTLQINGRDSRDWFICERHMRPIEE